jgi:hypothetical protein
MTDREMLEVALDEGRTGLARGGVPIRASRGQSSEQSYGPSPGGTGSVPSNAQAKT